MSAAPLPRYLLDTNILVAYVRAGDLGRWIEARDSLTATPTAAIISVVCEGEIRSLALQFAWGAPGSASSTMSLVSSCPFH